MSASPSPHIVLAITLAEPGGTTSFVLQYAIWLKAQGVRVTILAGTGNWLFLRAKEADISCIRVPWMQREIRPWFDVLAIFSLTRVLARLKPDVIHLNSSKMGTLGSLAARLAHVPRIVYFIGGWSFLEAIAPWKQRIYLLAERWTARFKDIIICLHPEEKRVAEERGIRPRGGILVVPNGIDLQLLDRARLSRAEARETLGISQDRFVFGTIAHFYPAKDLPAYVRSVAPILKQNISASLVLIGEGPERSAIERVIQETDLADQILLSGSKEQAHRLLAAFDVFVLPSTKEGMPFSLLEAMAARLPCITTTVGAHAWILEGTGSFLVRASDARALQQAFLQALQDRGRLIDIGEANRTVVEKRFPAETSYRAHFKTCFPS